MSFWLAERREGQDSDWICRFDPRFWTVNFPRPMMASVVSTAPSRPSPRLIWPASRSALCARSMAAPRPAWTVRWC